MVQTAFFVTMDVISLYTNIPHEEEGNWVASHYEDTLFDGNRHSAGLILIDRQTMFVFVQFILRNCTFLLNDLFYSQLHGTARLWEQSSPWNLPIYMFKWLSKFVNVYNAWFWPDCIARQWLFLRMAWHWREPLIVYWLLTWLLAMPQSNLSSITPRLRLTFLTWLRTLKMIKYSPPSKLRLLIESNTYTILIMIQDITANPYSQAIRYRRIIVDTDLLDTELTLAS